MMGYEDNPCPDICGCTVQYLHFVFAVAAIITINEPLFDFWQVLAYFKIEFMDRKFFLHYQIVLVSNKGASQTLQFQISLKICSCIRNV